MNLATFFTFVCELRVLLEKYNITDFNIHSAFSYLLLKNEGVNDDSCSDSQLLQLTEEQEYDYNIFLSKIKEYHEYFKTKEEDSYFLFKLHDSDYSIYLLSASEFQFTTIGDDYETSARIKIKTPNFSLTFFAYSMLNGYSQEREEIQYEFYNLDFKTVGKHKGTYYSEYSKFEELIGHGFTVNFSILCMLVFKFLREYLY